MWYEEGTRENGHQRHPPNVGLIPQLLPEVEAIHILIDKAEGVDLSGVHPDEWYGAYVLVEEAQHLKFVVEPL